MHTRHAILVVCVLACGHAGHPGPPPSSPSPASALVAGPTVSAESLRVAATDTFGVAIAQRLAPGTAVHQVSDRDALDLVDSGADIIVTDRQAVIRYATSRSDFAVIPLPWDRQYALLIGLPKPAPDVLDAVHADARVAQQHCPSDTLGARTWSHVYYIADDSIARSLAERLVGLGLARGTVPLRRDVRQYPDPVGILIVTRPVDSAPCSVDPLHVVPLIDTRSHLIVRRGSVGVVADTAGGVRLETTP